MNSDSSRLLTILISVSLFLAVVIFAEFGLFLAKNQKVNTVAVTLTPTPTQVQTNNTSDIYRVSKEIVAPTTPPVAIERWGTFSSYAGYSVEYPASLMFADVGGERLHPENGCYMFFSSSGVEYLQLFIKISPTDINSFDVSTSDRQVETRKIESNNRTVTLVDAYYPVDKSRTAAVDIKIDKYLITFIWKGRTTSDPDFMHLVNSFKVNKSLDISKCPVDPQVVYPTTAKSLYPQFNSTTDVKSTEFGY